MKKLLLVTAFGVLAVTSHARVTVARIFSSNMVLQRNQPLKIWGWASKGEKVTVVFKKQTVSTVADAAGNWKLTLQPETAGGPYTMKLSGENEVQFDNILVGDVYICSGQSNMEWILRNTNNAQEEIAASTNPLIRHFTVQKNTSFTPEKDIVGGEWQQSDPAHSGDFSAVAYYFGRKLAKDINVPIGLINSSWGGTNIETWISWDAMVKFPRYASLDVQKLNADRKNQAERRQQYEADLKQDKGNKEKWFATNAANAGWTTIALPKIWEQTNIGHADGIVWFKKEFELPAGAEKQSLKLSLGPIDDIDHTWINGLPVGNTSGYNVDRIYDIPASVLKAGKNTIVVKVDDTGGGGGIYGEPKQLYIEQAGQKISLAGDWQYKAEVLSTNYGVMDTGPNSFPSQLYNAMIAPIIPYAIKGGIWYQGESNAGEAYLYRTYFPALINNWRAKWGQQFPFFWVQLANFMKPDEQPAQSDWAELREAQSMTLKLPKTGQAVITDIGEANDIHPRNKKDVGERLALAAEKVVYSRNIVYSGPVYQSAKTVGNKIVLTFTNAGSGLMAKGNITLQGFAIAGADEHFVWATAVIKGNTVEVYSSEIKSPVAVRYAWGNNPDKANLYNKEGLPASSFRTDTWKGITQR